MGEIQGTTEVWPQPRGLRFLSIYHQPRKLPRIQSQGFPAGDALFPEEQRLHRGAATDLYWRTKQCAQPARAGGTESICPALREIRRQENRGRHERVFGKLRPDCPLDRKIISEFRDRDFAA